VTVDICPACGYPTVGPGMCAFCRPVVALTGNETFKPKVSAAHARPAGAAPAHGLPARISSLPSPTG
jgi:hypothetical protein